MSQSMVTYKVKPEQAAQNEALVRNVYDELRRIAPAGLHYATFVLDDGVSYVHISFANTADGQNPLTDLAAFKAYVEQIRDRCDEAPTQATLREVGSYNFWQE